MNNNIAVGLILLSLFAASNVFGKSDVSKAKPHPSKAPSAEAISDAKALADAAEAQVVIDAKILSDAKAASNAKAALDAKALSDLKALSNATNVVSPASEQTRAERAQARAELAKADAALAKYCLESEEDKNASDMLKAERDRACATKAAKEAAESAADANSERAREDRAKLYAESENARRIRDEIYAKASKLKAADEVNVESPEGVVMRLGTGDPVLGKQKSQLCQGCHGLRGYSLVTLIPKLAGQYADYIIKELRNFEAGTRSNEIMSAMSLTVEDDDLEDIGAYFASQKKMSGGNLPPNSIGKELFLNGDSTRGILPCVNCHGSDGKGRRPWTHMFPVIGGQHKDYLRRQLDNFRSGFRANSPVGIMNKEAQFLTDEEVEGLIEYLSTR